MNFKTYGSMYSYFHQCSLSLIRNDIIVFDFGSSPFENWIILRSCPSESISVDSKKPLLLALKSFFKSDVAASVISNSKYNWTVCLGNERMIYPVNREAKPVKMLHLYATPYFVTNPDIVNQYMHGMHKPAYENVYFYKNTILYLDNQDLPYPGGYYFDEIEPTEFYRICFLSEESIDYVVGLAAEWQSRREVLTIPFMTRSATALPKFINFRPVSDFRFSESKVISTGTIQRKLSFTKPEHILQDILISYYKNVSRLVDDTDSLNLTALGLIVEWPMHIILENSKAVDYNKSDRKFITLSINGNNPNRVVYVMHPYDRYVEYDDVPATVWTPVSFVFSTFLTDIDVRKVVLDTVVVGFVYREMFFCLSQPLLEGRPNRNRVLNGQYLLSLASTDVMESDPNIRIVESFKYDENHSLRRVALKGIVLETWCLTRAENTHPYPRTIRLPYLVNEWLSFFTRVGPNPFNADIRNVRLALMLSKHNICFDLVATDKCMPIGVSDEKINIYAHEKIVQFINEARIVRFNEKKSNDESSSCVIN